MSDTVITVDSLSKSYRIGLKARHGKTFREAFTDSLLSPFRRLRDIRNPQSAIRSSSDDTFWALKDVSFEVKRGEVVGIIGRNGAGKSTLLKILSRITEPTSGEVRLRGRVASLLEVGTGFHPELTGRENIYLNGAILGMKRAEITRKFDEIVAFAEVEKFLDTPVKRYSSGMYVRLAFAVAAHLEPEILIVDEVLSVGDAEFQKKCLGKMQEVSKGQGRTVLFVSHNMAAVQQLCTCAMLLKAGCLEVLGSVPAVTARYFGSKAQSEVTFDAGPLQRVVVAQKADAFEIVAHYSVSGGVRLPCLGFVISDVLGHPVVGSNPRLAGVERLPSVSHRGAVTVRLCEPKLLDGTYRLSVWFGDYHQDLIEHRECLTFAIAGMAGARQLPAAVVGSAAAKCEWRFDSLG